MTSHSTIAALWLLRTALGGGLVLLLTWVVVRLIRQPARRQRFAEFGLGAALLVAVLCAFPAWLSLPIPVSRQATPETSVETLATAQPPEESPLPPLGPVHGFAVLPRADGPLAIVQQNDSGNDERPRPNDQRMTNDQARMTKEEGSGLPSSLGIRHSFVIWPSAFVILLIVYVSVSSLFLVRWLLAHLTLWRLLATAQQPPEDVAELCASMTPDDPVRLLVSDRLRVPVSFGIRRPTVVLPVSFCGHQTVLRWVFNHELAHLRRRDPWTCFLFNLGQVVFWYLPWFWWLHREVRLCQEYLADAAVLDEESRPEEYAQFLLSLTSAPAVPAAATGVSGYSSDLSRRITMMLGTNFKLERLAPRWWLTAAVAGLLSLAVLIAGVGFTTAADDPKEQPKKEQPKKEEPKKEDPLKTKPRIPEVDDLIRNLPPGAMDPKELEELQKELQKAFERLNRAFPGAGGVGTLPAPVGRQKEGRLGVRIDRPTDTLIEQLDLPRGEGLVIQDVEKDSAAAKVGLKAHDILLAVDGKAVPSDAREFLKVLDGIKANTAVDAVVLRKGKKETLKGLSLPEVKEEKKPAIPLIPKLPLPNLPGVPGVNIGGVGNGNVTMTVNRDGHNFTTAYREGDVSVNVRGVVKDGKATADEIVIEADGKSTTYTDVEKVPEEYRDKVKKALEASAKPRVKLEIRRR